MQSATCYNDKLKSWYEVRGMKFVELNFESSFQLFDILLDETFTITVAFRRVEINSSSWKLDLKFTSNI